MAKHLKTRIMNGMSKYIASFCAHPSKATPYSKEVRYFYTSELYTELHGVMNTRKAGRKAKNTSSFAPLAIIWASTNYIPTISRLIGQPPVWRTVNSSNLLNVKHIPLNETTLAQLSNGGSASCISTIPCLHGINP